MPATKTALVTGAGARIGRNLAIQLAKMGYAVAVHYRQSRADAEQTVAEIQASGGKATPVRADLCKETECSSLIRKAEECLGEPLCLLVNNAAEFAPDTALSYSPAQWDAHMRLNLQAPITLAQNLAQRLPKSEQGHIINIIDQRIHQPDPAYFTYSLSKAALWTATRMLAQTLAPALRVNAIGPGTILPAAHESKTAFQNIAQARLSEHAPTLHDLEEALAYLVEAPAVTGQMLTIDSGLHLATHLKNQAPEQKQPHTPFPIPGHGRILTLENLEVAAEIGVYDSEHGKTQPLACTLQIVHDSAPVPKSLAETLDYALLCETARKIAASRHFPLLENFAESLAETLAHTPGVRSVNVQVRKPRANSYIGAVPGVSVHRQN